MDIKGTDKSLSQIILSADYYKKGDIVVPDTLNEHEFKVVSWVKNVEEVGCVYLFEKQFSDYELFKAKYHYNNLIDMGVINGIKFTI